MREDTADRIHRDEYGRSDKVNAPENQNREFQDGYRAGVDTLGEDAVRMMRHQNGEIEIFGWVKSVEQFHEMMCALCNEFSRTLSEDQCSET